MPDPNEVDDNQTPVPETRVLAIASHVVYGYVGNTMATFCMQTLGCEVDAINTVNFSNHTGYKQWTGTRTSAEQVADLYKGLRNSNLLDYDVLLSGYIPSADVLHEVTTIARDLKFRRNTLHPGRLFWALDPVMGDQGRLYVSQELVQGYKNAIKSGTESPDLVVPNSFELELLSGVRLSGSDESGEDGGELQRQPTGDNYEAELGQVKKAIEVLHNRDGVRMVMATSVKVRGRQGVLCVVGSEKKSDGSSRCFVVEVPVLECFFSGTGDMFAGLIVARLREEAAAAGVLEHSGYASDDSVQATDLPLAKATVKVLSSMSAVLQKTLEARNKELKRWEGEKIAMGQVASVDAQTGTNGGASEEKTEALARTKAAEVRAVRNARDLIHPKIRFEAKEL